MVSKTLAAIVIIFALFLFIPMTLAIFGIVTGFIGGVFGVIFGLIGGIFSWPFRIFHCNFSTLVILLVLIVVIAKSRTRK